MKVHVKIKNKKQKLQQFFIFNFLVLIFLKARIF
jgi:hypothetical protein